MFKFVHMSKYGDHTHGDSVDCVSQLKIGQAGYLLNHPRINEVGLDK